MRKSKYNIVALPTGSGKTYIAARAADALSLSPLVICPKSAKSAWALVCKEYNVTPVAIVNWERLKTGRTPWLERRGSYWEWHLPPGCFVIVDEVHRGCSGIDTQIGVAAVTLKKYNVPVLMMSATMASTPMQLRHTGYLLGLHSWTKDSFFRWCLAHGCRFDTFLGHWVTPKGRRLAEEMQKIRTQMGDRILYMKSGEIPGFPETVIEARLFDLDTEDTGEINKAWDEMNEHMKTPGCTELAELVKARHRTEWIKCGLLCDLIQQRLEEGMSVVVFMNFKDTTYRLRDLLKERNIQNISYLTGDTNDANRVVAMQHFQDNRNHVFLCTTGAGGFSISLHDVHHERPRVAYINPSYSASETRQALGRIQRVGGTKSLQVFPLVADTVEERVYRAITNKLNALDALNETLTDNDVRGIS